MRRFIFEAVVMITCQACERRPLLAAVMNKLPLVFADRAARRWLSSRAKLCSALHADKVFHREIVMGQDRACPSNFWWERRPLCRPTICLRQWGGALSGALLASRVGKQNCFPYR